MKEDYIITINGKMEGAHNEEADTIQLITKGSFLHRNDTFFITYKESEATGYPVAPPQ